MNFFTKANRYENSVREKSVCQRLTRARETMKPLLQIGSEVWVVLLGAYLALRWILLSAFARSKLVLFWLVSYMFVLTIGVLENVPGIPCVGMIIDYLYRSLLGFAFETLVWGTYTAFFMLVMWACIVICAAGIRCSRMYSSYKQTVGMMALKQAHPHIFHPQLGEKELARQKYVRNLVAKLKAKRKDLFVQNKMDPQLGLSMFGGGMISSVIALADNAGVPIDDTIVSKMENCVALFVALQDSVTTPQLCAIMFMFFKTNYPKAFSTTIGDYLAQICDTEFSTQSESFTSRGPDICDAVYDSQAGTLSYLREEDKPSWLRLLKDCRENWTMVIRNEGFDKISKILSLAIALGLCEASSIDFRVNGMKLFSIGAAPKHACAVDFIDAVFDTVVYFAEGGYACFQRGSIKPLLYGNMESEEFEENYGLCQQGFDYAKAGNLDQIAMDNNDYDQLLCRTIEKCSEFVRSSRGSVEKNVFRRKLDVLRTWQASFRQSRVQGGLREAPYSVGVFGGTGVGKSSIANILMVTTLLHNNHNAHDDFIVTLNENDKYMSNMRSYVNGILIDDIGNTKPDFVEKAPTSLMIQLVNNVRTYANMADLDQKGKISVEPKVVIGTKNVKDSCATIYSNEPASVARRDRITLTVEVREQFRSDGMLDSEKVRKYYENQGMSIPLIPDLWEITVEKAYPVKSSVEGAHDSIGWKVLRWGGMPLHRISIKHLVRYIAEDSSQFYLDQEALVNNSNNLASKFKICPRCKLVSDVCNCAPMVELPRAGPDCPTGQYCTLCEAPHPKANEDDDSLVYSDAVSVSSEESLEAMDVQFGERIVYTLSQKYFRWTKRLTPRVEYWSEAIEERTLSWALKRLDWLEQSPYTHWTNWVPTQWLSHDRFKNLVWFTHEHKLKERIRSAYMNHILLMVFVSIIAVFLWFPLLLLNLIPMLAMGRIVEVEKVKLYEEVAADNRAMPELFKMYRDRHMKWITRACFAIAGLYAIAQLWKASKMVPSAQGNIAPTSDAEIVARDAEPNQYAGVVVTPMPCSEKSRTTVVSELEALTAKNLAHMRLKPKGSEKEYECGIFFLCSNVALVPNHMWLADDIFVSVTRHDPSKIGGNFKTWLCKHHSVHIPGTDLTLVWVPNGGDWKDLTDYLPERAFPPVPARMVYKDSKGQQLKVSGDTPQTMLNTGRVHTKACSFDGANYKLPFNTFRGLCMAPLVTETKGPLLGGFHLGGRDGAPEGCCGLFTRTQFDDAFKKLKELPSVVLAKSEGYIPKEIYGIQYYECADVHPKSAINWLPVGAYCKYYGQCIGRATYQSDVEPTVISDKVEEVTGVKQKWGPPKFNKNWPFQASLQHSTCTSSGVEGSLLIRSGKSLLRAIITTLDRMPGLKASIRPLTEMETVCGRDGFKIMGKMPPNTSVGYPLSGPKANFLTPLDPDDHPTHQSPAELDSMFWKHAYEMEELYLKGERAYPIFKACLKDEPTKLTKDKVRVFQGAPVAFQLLIRKYYLPIARAMSMVPLVSECAVGINAQGPEWDQLAKHVKRYGSDRILAGDYSKYDLRMPAQVMFAAFRVMIDIAEHCGYSERDICIMEGIATDICYPLMAYNGDLIQHFGSNPSGQNLTVYINSIVNSLLFRCAYYEICKDRKDLPDFKDACSLITYGDDAKSSVKSIFPEFNHISVAKFLSDRDMKFTMPDKESEPTEYMKDEDADLLKRKNIFSQDTGLIMGALDENSIFKSLHCVLASKAITREHQAMQIIDGALREWFAYGRDHYEMRRAQMLEIAVESKISHGCEMIYKTYDEVLATYKEKYDIQGREYVPILPRPSTAPTVKYVPLPKARKTRGKYNTKRMAAAAALIELSKKKKNS